MTELSKRERIVRELASRLKARYPTALVQRGFFAASVQVFPSLYIFEGEETASLKPAQRRGQYELTLPINIAYFSKGLRPNELYERGNALLKELCEAIETDELFSGLVIRYSRTADSIETFADNVVDVEVVYEFTYTDYAPWLTRQGG